MYKNLDKHDELGRLLQDLSDSEKLSSEEKFNVFYNEAIKVLESVYSNDFRHQYSKIYSFLAEIDSDKNDGRDITTLSQNIELLKDKIFENLDNETTHGNKSEWQEKFFKLYDHVILDIARINVMKDFKNKFQSSLSAVKENVVSDTEKIVSGLKEKSESQQSEIENKYGEIKDEIKAQKFDLIALVTLVFSAFTMISLNVSLFSAAISLFPNTKTIVLMLVSINIILILTIFSIYTIIRKIHGDISSKEMLSHLGIALGVMLLIAILFSLCSCLNIELTPMMVQKTP